MVTITLTLTAAQARELTAALAGTPAAPKVSSPVVAAEPTTLTAMRESAVGGTCGCGKSFATKSGLAFHSGWCKGAPKA